MKIKTDEIKINRIEKRAIEVLAIAPMIRSVIERIGRDEAITILREVNSKEAFLRGKSMRKSEGQDVVETLVKDVATWGDGGVFDMTVLEQTPKTYFFNVSRCPYYEKYQKLGLEEFGVEFSCCRDEPFARGLSSRLRLERTKTIMEGADCCDFRYYLDSE
jgi:hypothetical protein